LVRIGIDRPAAAATGHPVDWTGGRPPARLRLATFADLAAVGQRVDVVVLDVRRRLEWADGHVAGAHHIPFNELPNRAAEVPAGECGFTAAPDTAQPSPRRSSPHTVAP